MNEISTINPLESSRVDEIDDTVSEYSLMSQLNFLSLDINHQQQSHVQQPLQEKLKQNYPSLD